VVQPLRLLHLVAAGQLPLVCFDSLIPSLPTPVCPRWPDAHPPACTGQPQFLHVCL